jgi:hypothetical protein
LDGRRGAEGVVKIRSRVRAKSLLERKARLGFGGYPVATIFYGPAGDVATKVAVGVVETEGAEPSALERWFSDSEIRSDPEILGEVLAFVEARGAKSVVMSDGLLGCPHEEGVDYPEGASCAQCPYWAGRDRFSGEREH